MYFESQQSVEGRNSPRKMLIFVAGCVDCKVEKTCLVRSWLVKLGDYCMTTTFLTAFSNTQFVTYHF